MLKTILLSICSFIILTASIENPCSAQTSTNSSQVTLPPSLSNIPIDPTIRIGKLENGVTYYIQKNKKPEHRAELRMAVKAGSMQEDDDQLGLAHFVEHMAFNGTAHFSKNELVNYLESIGTRFGPDLNAYTSFDETVYMLQVRTDDQDMFNKGMLILRDWADGIAFDDAEIDKERGVVISEWRTRLSAEQRMQQEYLPIIYYKSRYADRLPIGDPLIVQNAAYDVARRFYKDWYRPELTAIMVVGDIDVDAIEQKIKSEFGSIKPSQNPRQKEVVSFPVHDATFAKIVTDAEATNTRIQIYYKHKFTPVTTLVDYRDRLVQSLYNRMLGKRLAEFSRLSDPPFIFGSTGYYQDVADLAMYSSTAMAEAKNIRRAYTTLLEENQRVLQHGFTTSELEREKASILRQSEQNVLEKDKQESNRLISRLVYHFLEDNPVPDASQHLELYKAMMPTITLDEVSAYASKWITSSNNMVLITAPAKDLGMLPDSIELIKMMQEVNKTSLKPYVDIDVSAPILSATLPELPVINMKHDTVLGLYEWDLPNGIKVKAKPTSFKNDEILMSAYSPGGHSLYDASKYPSARSVSSVIQASGVGPYNATGLDKKLSTQRVSVTPFVFERFEGMSGSSSVTDLETMIQLAYLWVTAYREDSVALSAYINRERGRFANLLANPQNYFYDRVGKITSQNHPRRGFPTLESYDQIKHTEIMEIYRDRFKDVSDMTFFFVGNFDPVQLQKLTGRYLGAMPGGGRKETYKDVGDRMPSGVVDSVYNRGEAPSSLVQIVYHGTDQYNAAQGYVLQSLIELARIKLRESLREEESGVYGVSIYGSQSYFPVEQYSINIGFNADPPRTKELMDAAKAVIEKLKHEIDPADIIKVTETQRQSRIKDLEQNYFWMNSLVTSWQDQVPLTPLVELQTLERRIAGLNKEVLLAAANKYFNDKEVISVVMYPDKT